MKSRIELLPEKKLVGMNLDMTMADNKTRILWQSFMPRRKEIHNMANASLFSIQIVDPPIHIKDFNLHTPFKKWAAVEVLDHDDPPDGMEPFILEGGKYAVFLHQGPAYTFPQTLGYILNTWLPESGYEYDYRPQFEVLEEGYNPADPNAEEEVWIPIK